MCGVNEMSDKQIVAALDKVLGGIPDDVVCIEEVGVSASLYTTHGLIRWLFDHATGDYLAKFISLWNTADVAGRINIMVDIAMSKTESESK